MRIRYNHYQLMAGGPPKHLIYYVLIAKADEGPSMGPSSAGSRFYPEQKTDPG